jgi:hypothetical protein
LPRHPAADVARDSVSIDLLNAMTRLLFPLPLLLCCVCRAPHAAADDETDANIVTAIDISDSVSRVELDRLVDALAAAISSGPVVELARSGSAGKIGFAVFAWHHYRYSYIDWILIASEEDAREAASMIRRRILMNAEPETSPGIERFRGRRTDISAAIDYAGKLLDRAPYATRKRIVNIVGNGVDNVGEPAGPARDRFTKTGGTINGLVFGGDLAVNAYYRNEVVGGLGAFVVSLAGGDDFVDAFRRKFLSDIALLQDSPATADR